MRNNNRTSTIHIAAVLLTALALISSPLFGGALDTPGGGLGGSPAKKWILKGKVLSRTSEGVIVSGSARSSGNSMGNLYYVSGHPDHAKLFDGAEFKCVGLEAGTFEYTAVSGAAKTIPAFTYLSRS